MENKTGKRAHGRVTWPQAMTLGSTRLEALLESVELLQTSKNLDELLKHLLRTVMGRLLAGRGCIAIEDRRILRVALVRGSRTLKAGDPFDEGELRGQGFDTFFPIGDPAKPIGMLGVATPHEREIAPGESGFVNALLSIAASGITKAKVYAETDRLNRVLSQKVQDLRTLLELARGLNGAPESDQVARLLGLTLSGHWAVTRYAIAAWRKGHPAVLRQRRMKLPGMETYQDAISKLADGALVDELPENALAAVLRAAGASLVLPLRLADHTVGLIILGEKGSKQHYGDADIEFGIGVAAQAAVAFDNAWNLRETLEKKRIEEELALAATIQSRLFPAVLPEFPGYELAAHNRPARECGGDYYDVLPMAGGGTDGSHLLCVADVSGKGLAASILMSNLQATLRASLEYKPTLVELAARTNALLHATTPSNKYITAILMEFDPVSGTGLFVNAGHDGGVVMRADGRTEKMETTGTPLGLLPGLPYASRKIELHAGDVLAIYTDGVAEANSVHGEEWGEANFLECLARCHHLSAGEITPRVFEGIDAFVGTAPPHDDITVLVLKRTG